MEDDPGLSPPAPSDIAAIRRELRDASMILMNRGMIHSAQFAAELCTQMIETENIQQENEKEIPTQSSSRVSRPLFASASNSSASTNHSSSISQLSHEFSDDRIMFAKTLFDLREFDRCSHSLQSLCETRRDSHANFLRLYSLYLSGERRREEEKRENSSITNSSSTNNSSSINGAIFSSIDSPDSPNREIPVIRSSLNSLISQSIPLDAFEYYLFGLIEYNSNNKIGCRDHCIASLNLFPINWSCWELLGKCLDSSIELNEYSPLFPHHFMRSFFYIYYFVIIIHHEPHDFHSLFTIFQKLFLFFPQSLQLLLYEAVMHYHQQSYDEALILFQSIYKLHPFVIKYIDIYSNILYIKEEKIQLSYLAQEAMKKNKYSEQVQIVIGNYYSLKRQHEKALIYFNRAFKLNPHYHSALTLMGHEMVELRNESGAIALYRKAIDYDSRDYRAWYGCGQAYELLSLPSMALYYFSCARRLRPYDSRMWIAEGECYERCGRPNESLASFERAAECDDREGIAINKIAAIHVKRGEKEKAAKWYKQVLKKIDQANNNDNGDHDNNNVDSDGNSLNIINPSFSCSPDAIDAVTFLASYHLSLGDFTTAESLCQRLIDCGGQHKEQAMAWQQEIINKRMAANNSAAATNSSTLPTLSSSSSSSSLSTATPARPSAFVNRAAFFDTPES